MGVLILSLAQVECRVSGWFVVLGCGNSFVQGFDEALISLLFHKLSGLLEDHAPLGFGNCTLPHSPLASILVCPIIFDSRAILQGWPVGSQTVVTF